jgi:predicted nucleic acid-binding protein
MSAFDIIGSLRRLKPEKRTAPIARRNDADLAFVDTEPAAGPPLLLDSTVYIHVLRGKTPSLVDNLLAIRTLNHSSVVVGELTNHFGARIPQSRREVDARGKLLQVVNSIPAHRLLVPTAIHWSEAGIIAGMLARLGGYPAGQSQDDLNDALIFLQARSHGAVVLTANVIHFDYLQQIMPEGRVLFYRV